MPTTFNPEIASGIELISGVQRATRSNIQYSPTHFYFEHSETPTYGTDKKGRVRALGNCNVYAATAAQEILDNFGQDYIPYIGHCNGHFFALAVGRSGNQPLHLINADAKEISRPNLDSAGSDGGPIFLNQETVDGLRRGFGFVYSPVSRPFEAMVDDISDPIHQSWLNSINSSVGFLRWPHPGHEYLMLHSKIRKILKYGHSDDQFDESAVRSAISTTKKLRPMDITVDDNLTSYEVHHYGDRVVMFRNAVLANAISKFAGLAKDDEQLELCGELAKLSYQDTGPDFIVGLDSERHRREAAKMFALLAGRAQKLGSLVLVNTFLEQAMDRLTPDQEKIPGSRSLAAT